MKIERNWSMYYWQVVFILKLISLCALTSFSMDPVESSGDRLAIASTMFLTAVAFQLFIATLLPKLSYLTFLDKYTLTTMLFISGVVLFCAYVAYLAKDTDEAGLEDLK